MSTFSELEMNRLGEGAPLFRRIFEDGPLGMMIVGLDRKFKKVNATCCQMLGYSEEELTRLTVSDITHPDDLARDTVLTQQLLTGALPVFKVEKRYIKKDGRPIWAALTASLIRDHCGEPICGLGMIENITERKQTEMELRKKEASLSEAQRIAHLGSWEWNARTDEAWRSEEMFRIFGVAPNQIDATYQAFLNTIHPDDREHVAATIAQSLRERKPYGIEYRIIQPGGAVRFVYEQAEITCDEQGEPIRMTGVTHDITERKQTELALAKALAWQQAIFEGSRDAVFISDSRAKFVDVNTAACELTGYSKAELLTMSIADLHEEIELGAYRQFHHRIMAGEDLISEAKILRKDGTKVDAEFNSRRIVIADTAYMHTVARDLSDRIERERAEEKARMASKLAVDTIDAMCEGLALLSMDGNITHVNPALLRITGYPHHEFIGTPAAQVLQKLLKQKDFVRISTALEIALLGLAPEPFSTGIVRPDGQEVPVHVNVSFIKDENGAPTTMVVTVEDITELKFVENELRKLSLAVEQSPVSVVITDPNGAIEYVNPRFCQLTGYSHEEVIGKNPSILKSGVQSDDFYKQLWETITTGKEWRGEFCNKKKSGELYWESASICAICNPQGEISHFLAVKEDITERKRAELEFKKSEEKYRTLFEESLDAVLITEPDGKILDVNPAGVEMFGYPSREEFLRTGNAIALYDNPEDRAQVMARLTADGFVKNYDVKLKKRDGSPLDVILSSAAVRDESGRVVSFYGILHDLTHRKKIEQQLLQMQKMETIATLVSGIAHDFNNLLIVILGNIELALADARPNDPIAANLQRVEEAAVKARDLITKLLSFSRRERFKPQTININAVVDGSLSIMQAVAGNHISVETRLAHDLDSVLADPLQIHQILMNLCINARDAMPKGGQILLSTCNIDAEQTSGVLQANGTRRYVQLTISDTGVGMNKDVQARVFEPFFTTKEIGKGSGLGLPMVYGIVKQHKGHIEVDSQPGKGATFKIYFPAAPSSMNGKDHKDDGNNSSAKTDEMVFAKI